VQLPQIVSLLATWADSQPLVGRAWVFGSRARGEERDDSDVDIAVELDLSAADGADESGGTATWMFECGSWESDLGSLLPFPVDLEQFMGAKTPTIKNAIKRSSVLAYQKQGFQGKPT
jgi:predicted nucleotidyltransferase